MRGVSAVAVADLKSISVGVVVNDVVAVARVIDNQIMVTAVFVAVITVGTFAAT